MRIVVTGGAGYIGSHTVVELIGAGHEAVIVDNFVNAKPAVLDRIDQITGTRPVLVRGDVRNPRVLDQAFAAPVDAVIHFAGLKAVGESVAKPLAYYETNLDSTLALLAAMEHHDVRALVFSSSATVYGADGVPPLREDAATGATSPYGWTKVMIEQILADAAAADGRLRLAALRYFNPLGAHPSGLIGEDPQGIPNNLVPFLAQVAVGRREEILVFGDDYDTPDGTGVRDYIHVVDLARGPLAALDHLTGDAAEAGLGIWNLGSGRRHVGVRAGQGLLGGRRPGAAVPRRGPPAGRRRGVVLRSRQGRARARLDGPAHGRAGLRRHLALAERQPRRVPGVTRGGPAGDRLTSRHRSRRIDA